MGRIIFILALALPSVASAQESTEETGQIRVAHDLRAAQVDGQWVHARNGIIVVPCGPHQVRAGMGAVTHLDVPCGGIVAMNNEIVQLPPQPSLAADPPPPSDPPPHDARPVRSMNTTATGTRRDTSTPHSAKTTFTA